MRTKTNHKRTRLATLLAVVLAVVCTFALLPKVATADESDPAGSSSVVEQGEGTETPTPDEPQLNVQQTEDPVIKPQDDTPEPTVPDPKITAEVGKNSVQLPVTEDVTIEDSVSITGLTPNTKYTVAGTLDETSAKKEVVKADDKTITTDSAGEAKLTVTFTLKAADATANSGKTLAAKLTISGDDLTNPFVYNEDYADEKQKVAIAAAPEPEPEPEPTTSTLKISKEIKTPVTDAAIERVKSEIEQATSSTTKSTLEAQLKVLQERKSDAQAKEFEFTVTITDAKDNAVEDEYKYSGAGGKKDGNIKSGNTIKLKDGQGITIKGLPIGYRYKVKEAEVDNWKADSDELKGFISAEEAKAEFVNNGRGSFSISKTIKAADGVELTDTLKETEFTFTVNFYNSSEDRTSTGKEYSYEGDKTGTAKSGDTITLKGGEMITFKDLDPGIYVRVSESTKTNWTASASNLAGEIIEGKTRTAEFVNTYSPTKNNGNSSSSSVYTPTVSRATTTTTSRTASATPKTADPASIAPALASASLAIAAAGYAVRKRK